MEAIDLLVLETLSFFDPLTKEQIYLQFDPEMVNILSHLTREDLDKALIDLKKRKKIKEVRVDKDAGWIKIYPKRPWYRKLMLKFESLIERT